MSKSTLRRAAERQSHKARKQELLADLSVLPLSTLQTEDAMDHLHVDDCNDESHPFLSPALAPAVQDFIERHEPMSAVKPAQFAANQANSQRSTGPVSPEGKATVSQNRRSHGLTGLFILLDTEDPVPFRHLANSIYDEHNPQSDTEQRLADSVIQHYWLMQRAIRLQNKLLEKNLDATEADAKRLSLFMRYQSTHERSYYKALRELQNTQKQRQKSEIGFESQNRIQEAHEARVRLTHARAQTLEVDSACRHVMGAPLPGTAPISFSELTQACSNAIANLVFKQQHGLKAAA